MNRLKDASSPYLRQHADNPVAWWEWEPDAFAEARERDVPVFLSVGYSSCHWCHVMAPDVTLTCGFLRHVAALRASEYAAKSP